MDVEQGLTWVIIAVFAAIALAFVVNMFLYGLRGAIFGARLERTVGEVVLARAGLSSTTFRVHVLQGAGERKIGLELVAKGFLSYHVTTFSVSAHDAVALKQLLARAVG